MRLCNSVFDLVLVESLWNMEQSYNALWHLNAKPNSGYSLALASSRNMHTLTFLDGCIIKCN